MTDINKEIEEEAREYAKSICYPLVLVDHEHRLQSVHRLVEKVYERGYNSALHSYRWRNVSEELPELGIEVIITRNDGIRFLAWLDKDSELFFNVSGNEEYFLDEIQSWKPID